MKTTILGVSFSTRMLGLAVLQSGTLIDYSVKLFKETWTPAKMNRILSSLAFAIDNFTITDMVLSIPPIHYQEQPFDELWQAITIFGRERRLNVKMYRHKDLQQLCGREEMMSRKLLMETVVKEFPELEPYAKRESRSKNKYYYKMFEAIAAALLYEQDDEK